MGQSNFQSIQLMNSTVSHSTLSPAPSAGSAPAEEEVDLGHYLEALVAQKWLIAAVTVVVLAIGAIYAALQRPVYDSNLLIQVEDPQGSSKTFLAEAVSAFDVKTPASAEMEIIRSRTVLGHAIDDTKIDIVAAPRYVPYIGGWLARRATGLSDPGFLGFAGYVSGTEQITVDSFNVPVRLEASPFTVVAKGNGQYALQNPGLAQPLTGEVGKPLKAETRDGPIELTIAQLAGKPGAEFSLTKLSRLSTIGGLQARLQLSEKGKQSGIINVAMEDNDPIQLARVLNAVGAQYVRQNVERKAAEAQKTLAFLDVQLPLFKRQLEQSEEVYNRYRNQKGTVAFTEEASLVLGTAVDRQTRLLDLQQRRRDLESRFTAAHPSVQTLDVQIAAIQRDIGDVQSRIKSLPALQQEAVRMERDVKVNTELYQSLLNNAMQLRLVKEGKVGNVRVLDEATVSESPVKPQRRTIVGVALALGLFLGIVAAFIRNALIEQRIKDPHEVESQTALPVFSTIPLSTAQNEISQRRLTGATGVRLLAIERPDDLAVESLRSLRTAMQFAMLEAPNNRVMITGATPGVGKSFVTSNFAALMAAAGKRTLLIDADLRRGHLHQYLGLQRHGGLSE
ncbi:MAG: tyrosine protein kinase, partial [Comamonadaceae bacterium]